MNPEPTPLDLNGLFFQSDGQWPEGWIDLGAIHEPHHGRPRTWRDMGYPRPIANRFARRLGRWVRVHHPSIPLPVYRHPVYGQPTEE